MMLRLCVETSTPVESVALLEGDTLLAERAAVRRRGHGPTVLATIDGVLDDAGRSLGDVEGFVCGLGPGSFTGLRIALATLKGFAVAADRPLWGVPTRDAFVAVPGVRRAMVLDARRGEIFVHADDSEPACVAPERVDAVLDPQIAWVLLGSGVRAYRETLIAKLPAASVPDAEGMHWPRAGLLGAAVGDVPPADTATLEPFYVRRSDAEINYPDGYPDASVLLPRR